MKRIKEWQIVLCACTLIFVVFVIIENGGSNSMNVNFDTVQNSEKTIILSLGMTKENAEKLLGEPLLEQKIDGYECNTYKEAGIIYKENEIYAIEFSPKSKLETSTGDAIGDNFPSFLKKYNVEDDKLNDTAPSVTFIVNKDNKLTLVPLGGTTKEIDMILVFGSGKPEIFGREQVVKRIYIGYEIYKNGHKIPVDFKYSEWGIPQVSIISSISRDKSSGGIDKIDT